MQFERLLSKNVLRVGKRYGHCVEIRQYRYLQSLTITCYTFGFGFSNNNNKNNKNNTKVIVIGKSIELA